MAEAGGVRRHLHGTPFEVPWREPRLITIDVLTGEGKLDPESPPICDADLGNADQVFDLLAGLLRLIGAHKAGEIVFVSDGADWIWARVDRLVERAGLDPKRVHKILDFYHASEHVSDALKACKNLSYKEREAKHKALRRTLLEPDVAGKGGSAVGERSGCMGAVSEVAMSSVRRWTAHGASRGLLQLCRYVCRPPLAKARLEVLPGDRVRLRLERPWSDGTGAFGFSALELLERLASLAPPPGKNQVLYHGVLAANAAWRAQVVPGRKELTEEEVEARAEQTLSREPSRSKRPRWTPWERLLWRGLLGFTAARVCGSLSTSCGAPPVAAAS